MIASSGSLIRSACLRNCISPSSSHVLHYNTCSKGFQDYQLCYAITPHRTSCNQTVARCRFEHFQLCQFSSFCRQETNSKQTLTCKPGAAERKQVALNFQRNYGMESVLMCPHVCVCVCLFKLVAVFTHCLIHSPSSNAAHIPVPRPPTLTSLTRFFLFPSLSPR